MQIVLICEVALFTVIFLQCLTDTKFATFIGNPGYLTVWGIMFTCCTFFISWMERFWVKLLFVLGIAIGQACFICGVMVASPFLYFPILALGVAIPFLSGFNINKKLTEDIIPGLDDKKDWISAYSSLYSAFLLFYSVAFFIAYYWVLKNIFKSQVGASTGSQQ